MAENLKRSWDNNLENILEKRETIDDDEQEEKVLIIDESAAETTTSTSQQNVSAFNQYVEGILESLKVGETKDNSYSILEQKRNNSKKVSNSSSFTIEALLGLNPSNKGKYGDHRQKKVYTPAIHLNFMDILSDIRRQRAKVGDNLEHMTECRLCGSCSFSQSKAVAANYMAQHLYTHIPFPIYSCLLCSNYNSSWKPRVQNHIRTTHPYVNKKESTKFIRDHRLELDSCLCSLAIQCYGLYITSG